MEKKDEKSEKARQAALSRWEKKPNANAMQTQCDSNANKVKESKGKEIKEKDNKSAASAAIVDYFSNNLHPITEIERAKLLAYLDDGFDHIVILYAIEKAVTMGKRNLAYIEGILKGLRGKNIMTMQAVEAAERDFQAKKNGGKESTRGDVAYTPIPPPDAEQMQRNQEFMKDLLQNIGKEMR